MSVVIEAKTLIEAVENAKNKLATEKIIYKSKERESGKIFKTKIYEVTAIRETDLITEIKDYLKEVVEGLGLQVNFETSKENDTYYITMYSNNNSALIGKNGKTLSALETLVKNKVNIEWGFYPKVVLDVENYKEKRISALERMAVKIAKEVRDTKVDVALENMNSYERRIIHNKLANFKGISTESVGTEPERHIIIKSTD
mgnify:FL=1